MIPVVFDEADRCRAPERPRVKPRENPEESPPRLHPVQGFSPRNMQRRWWEKREECEKRERGDCGNGHVPERKPGTCGRVKEPFHMVSTWFPHG